LIASSSRRAPEVANAPGTDDRGRRARTVRTSGLHPAPEPEDVGNVRSVVAEILDALVPDVPSELQDVVRIRAATRRVLEAHLPPVHEDRLLVGLARQAARSPLPLWSLEAMEAELLEPDPPELLPSDVVRRARILRLWGHGSCPTCRQPLISESEIDQDDRRRLWAEQDRHVRRNAVMDGLAS
jgi:hypothetical protein